MRKDFKEDLVLYFRSILVVFIVLVGTIYNDSKMSLMPFGYYLLMGTGITCLVLFLVSFLV